MADQEFPLDPIIEEYKKGVDTTLLEENLRRTPEERILAIMSMQLFVEEMQRRRRSPSRDD